MIKTVLLTPPLTTKDRMGHLAEGGAVMPGLGLLYIASMMREEGLPVTILDAEGRGLDLKAAVQAIVGENPEVLGITATTLSICSATRVAREVKSRIPGIKIFLGGPHVTAMPEETLDSEPCIDGFVWGDGERSFTKIVRNIEEGVGIGRGVHGLVWRQGGQTLINPKNGYFKDLDQLPFPAWDLLTGFPAIYRPPFHSYRRLPVANIITTRGCPHVCSFCDQSVFGDKVHSHSVDYVIEMIQYLVKDFGIAEISIKDDMFILSPERVSEFCQQIRDRNLDITWSCNARVNCVSKDMLREMKHAGCWMISYGIESGSPKMLKKMMKGITKKQVTDALVATRNAGIVSKGFFMIGVPGETIDTLKETLSFVEALPLDELNVNFFTPFPGSKLYREVLSEGFKPDFARMNMLHPVYVPQGLAEKDLMKYQKRIIRSFYLNPSKMAFYGLRALKDTNEFKRVFRMGKMFVTMAYADVKKG
jgi:anaerobic magnesium-protoporphyrin IX monomethyl ester cyclase